MGPKFGHPSPLSETDLASLKTHDLALIRQIEEGNPEGFFKAIQEERNHHNVCGVPNIYAFLKIMEGRRGQLIEYGQYFEPPTASAVSYASLVF
jgi:AmmeMemoRadiSam system protein B